MQCFLRLGALTDLAGKLEAFKQCLAEKGCQVSEPLEPKQQRNNSHAAQLLLSSDNGLSESGIRRLVKARGLHFEDHQGEHDGFMLFQE